MHFLSPRNSTLRRTSNRRAYMWHQKTHSRVAVTAFKLETTQTSIGMPWAPRVRYIHAMGCYTALSRQTTALCSNRNGFRRHSVEPKVPSVSVKCRNWLNHGVRIWNKSRMAGVCVTPRGLGWGSGPLATFSFLAWALVRAVSSHRRRFTRLCVLTSVCFSECKLHLNKTFACRSTKLKCSASVG